MCLPASPSRMSSPLTTLLAAPSLSRNLLPAGAARSPSWKRLSSASVPESIRELARKYERSDSESLRGLTATPPALGEAASPAPAVGAAETMEAGAAAGTPLAAAGACCEGSSPALQPTPHAELDTLMRRNALFEGSPAQASPVGAATAAAPAAAAGVPPSPGTALAQLLAPVLLATIDEIGVGGQQGQAPQKQGEGRSSSFRSAGWAWLEGNLQQLKR